MVSRPITLALAFTAAASIGGCRCNGTTYDAKVPAPLESDHGKYLSMDVAPDGRPVISYYDVTLTGLGFALGTVEDDGSVVWNHEQVDGYADAGGLDTGDVGQYTSLKVAPDGSVWVAYQAGNALKVAHRVGGVWTTELADAGQGAAPKVGRWTSLALDASGEPVVAHHDEASGTLRVARRAGGTWTATVVRTGEPVTVTGADGNPLTRPASVGMFADLFIAGDQEYIAYYNAAAQQLELLEGNADSYAHTVVHSAAGGNVGLWPSIFVDEQAVVISFEDRGAGHLGFARRKTGEAFEVEVADDSPRVGADTEIYNTPNGYQILYFDGQNNNLKTATRSNQSWVTNLVGGEGAAVGFFNETAVWNDTRFFASYDYTNRNIFFATDGV
jgi:hypothetical protein